MQSVGTPLYSWTRIELFNVLASISGLLLLAAATAFVLNMWGRARALGQGKSGLVNHWPSNPVSILPGG